MKCEYVQAEYVDWDERSRDEDRDDVVKADGARDVMDVEWGEEIGGEKVEVRVDVDREEKWEDQALGMM